MRLRSSKKRAKDFLAEQSDLIILNPEQWKGRWRELFYNYYPIHVELGMGKGQFI